MQEHEEIVLTDGDDRRRKEADKRQEKEKEQVQQEERAREEARKVGLEEEATREANLSSDPCPEEVEERERLEKKKRLEERRARNKDGIHTLMPRNLQEQTVLLAERLGVSPSAHSALIAGVYVRYVRSPGDTLALRY